MFKGLLIRVVVSIQRSNNRDMYLLAGFVMS